MNLSLSNLNLFWNNNKAAIIVGSAGVIETIINNSWIFTSVPLPGQDHSDAARKFFYLLAEMMLSGVKWGGLGMGVDYVREMNQRQATETSSLIPAAKYAF